MCKSADERGGPYRCSADMHSRYESATKQLRNSREKAAEASAADASAQERARAYAEMLAEPNLSGAARDVLTKHAASYAAEAAESSAAYSHAMQKLSSASDRWRSARADYDSTPQGLVDLQRELHAAQSAQDEATVESCNGRIGAATDRMSQESAQRAERWGSTPSRPFVPQLDGEAASGATRDALTQGGRGHMPVIGATQQTGETTGTHRTYTFHPDGKREVRVQVVDQPGAGQATASAVVARMVRSSERVSAAPNFVQYCHQNGVDRSDSAQVKSARSSWDEGRKFAKQGERIFGTATWNSLVEEYHSAR